MLDTNLLERVSSDRALGCALLFPDRHPQASPAFHVEMVDLWRSADEFILFEVFREGGKTTKAEEHVLLEACFGNFNYALLIGETYDKGCQRLQAIDHEARRNVRLTHLFGGPVLARRSIENWMWFKSGSAIQAVGWEQELQGFKHHDARPDLAWMDDIENAERIRDAAAVEASMRKFWLELVPALDKTRRRIRYTQTRRAQDCMVSRFAANPEWVYFGMPICDRDPDDPECRSNWPDRYPLDWVRAEKRRYVEAGMLSEFLLAYMLQAVNPATKPFKDDELTELDVSPWHWMPRYAIYDPSRTSRERRTRAEGLSDRTGKVVVSRMGTKILIHESVGAWWAPDAFLADVFATQERHACAKIAIEKNSLDDWLLQPLRLEMLKRGVPLPLATLQAPQDRSKEQFILGLQPFAQARDIVLVGGRAQHATLVAEWVNFPHGPRDILNALAYALQVFAAEPIYADFSPANIGEAPPFALGQEGYVGAAASSTEAVLVLVVRDGRRLTVARDFAAAGAIPDAVKTLAFGLRAAAPGCAFQVFVPGDTFDQWQRLPLVPALRAERFSPMRAPHAAVSRGTLAERLRTEWRHARLLVVDRRAKLTLNALAAGYALAPGRGARTAAEPETGTSRLIGEALEAVVAALDRAGEPDGAFPKGANVSVAPSGREYMTANPRRAR